MSHLKQLFGAALSAESHSDPESIVAAPEIASDNIAMPEDGAIAEANADVQAEVDAAGGLQDATLSLEEILEQLEQTMQEGGLNNQGSQFAQIAINQVRRQMGIGTDETIAIESDMPAMLRTRLTMENISNNLREAANAFLAFCRRIWEAVSNFFVQIFAKAARVASKAEKLVKIIQERKAANWSTNEHSIDLKHLNAWVDFDGVKQGRPLDFLEATVGMLDKQARQRVDAATEWTARMVEDMKNAREENYKAPLVPTRIGELAIGHMQPAGAAVGAGALQRQMYRMPRMPGDLCIEAVLATEAAHSAQTQSPGGVDPKAVEAAGRDSFRLVPSESKSTRDKTITLTLQELEELVSYVSVACNKVLSWQGEFKRVKSANDKSINDLRTLAERFTGVTGVDVTSGFNATRWNASIRAVQRLQANMMDFPKVVAEYVLRLSSADLHIAAAMLSVYKPAA